MDIMNSYEYKQWCNGTTNIYLWVVPSGSGVRNTWSDSNPDAKVDTQDTELDRYNALISQLHGNNGDGTIIK